MAELIPLEYRIRKARAGLIRRWTGLVALAVAIAAGGLIHTYMWRRQQAAEYARVAQQYQEKSAYLVAYSQLRARRDDLAARMKNIENIQNDKVLLALMGNVSAGFGSRDSLDYIHIDAHPTDKKPEEARYSVRIRGITASDTTHSQLLERLTAIGKKAALPMVVPLGEKHVSPMFDGEVTSFDITCVQPVAKGG